MLNTLSKNVTVYLKDCLFDFFFYIYLVMLTCMNETESSIGALLVRVAKYFMWKCLFRCIQAT